MTVRKFYLGCLEYIAIIIIINIQPLFFHVALTHWPEV